MAMMMMITMMASTMFSHTLAAIDEAMPFMEARRWWLFAFALAVTGVAVILWALAAKRRGAAARRCPKCGFDMRSTIGLRCGECGHVARNERAMLRLRPWQRRGAIACGLLIAIAYPGYRAVLWSHDRDWTPPLSRWRVLESHRLPNGARVEVLEPRHHREFGRSCRITARDGSVQTIESHSFSIVSGAPARDMTGDGEPDLMVMDYSGGAHCCETYHLFALPADGSVRPITELDARDGGRFVDLDGDGIDEFETHDWSLAYALTCFACLKYPRVVLRFDAGGYRADGDLMRQPAPSESELAEIVRTTRAAADRALSKEPPVQQAEGYPIGRARDHLWGVMLKLIYSGHEARAYRLFDDAWPPDFPVRHELQAFRDAVAASPFHSVIEAMQVHGLKSLP